ncbi:MAG: hypothetical protein AAFX07_00620 [Pseudomonadota bacterium]
MTDIQPIKSRPVPEVVEALEFALAEAKAGRLRNVAIVAEGSSGDTHFNTWGLENNVALVGMLQRVQYNVLAGMDRPE